MQTMENYDYFSKIAKNCSKKTEYKTKYNISACLTSVDPVNGMTINVHMLFATQSDWVWGALQM